MKTECLWGAGLSVLLALQLMVDGTTAYGQQRLANFDTRRESVAEPATLDAPREAAADRLQARVPGIKIHLDEVLVSPKFIYNTHGLLSGPASEPEILGTRAIPAPPRAEPEDPHQPIKRFLDQNQDLFGYDSGVLASGSSPTTMRAATCPAARRGRSRGSFSR